MIYTNITKKAMTICYNAHKDKFDKGQIPYIIHPILIAEKMSDEETTVVALLHDVVEDTNITFELLENDGIPKYIIDALKCLTKNDDIDYIDYIKNIKNNEIARKVKIEDIKHNMDLSRIENISKRDILRIEKYKKALKILEK